jgi:4-azaleucine resistance transporter AzlC
MVDPSGGEAAAPGDPSPRSPAPPDPVGASVVLGLAVGVFGISFGVLAVATGLSPAQACAMSLLVFTGASQFAVVGVIGSGGSTPAALASALLLAARNAAYGLSLSSVVTGRLPTRLLGAQLVIDESTAMATAQRTPADRRRGFWAAGLAVFVCWNVGTLLGALGGDAIGDPETYGLDAAFPAGFVALVVPHLRSLEGRVVAALGVATALVLVPFAPAGLPVLAAAAAVLVGLRTPGRGERAPDVGPAGDPA